MGRHNAPRRTPIGVRRGGMSTITTVLVRGVTGALLAAAVALPMHPARPAVDARQLVPTVDWAYACRHYLTYELEMQMLDVRGGRPDAAALAGIAEPVEPPDRGGRIAAAEAVLFPAVTNDLLGRFRMDLARTMNAHRGEIRRACG